MRGPRASHQAFGQASMGTWAPGPSRAPGGALWGPLGILWEPFETLWDPFRSLVDALLERFGMFVTLDLTLELIDGDWYFLRQV